MWVLLFAILSFIGSSSAADEPSQLSFSRHSALIARRDITSLREVVTPGTVRVFEPYEEREVRFEAFAFDAVLDAVYSADWRSQEELLFTCRDGYQPTVPVQRVLEHRAWLAFARVDESDFSIQKLESGSRRRVALAPFYLVWENLDDAQLRSEGDYGWPYQLIGVDLIRARDRFPNMAPPHESSGAAHAGFSAFRVHCSRCHAINGDGGAIGPELNTPINPVEQRETDWLRRWIDDPSQILAAARMPRLNPVTPDRERTIENLIAYLEAMSRSKKAVAAAAESESGSESGSESESPNGPRKEFADER